MSRATAAVGVVVAAAVVALAVGVAAFPQAMDMTADTARSHKSITVHRQPAIGFVGIINNS